MGADRATRAVLKDLAREHALTRGDDDIAVVRAAYDRVFGSWTACASKPTREDWTIVEGGGHRGRALIVEPVDAAATNGSVLFIHGGGWSLGSALCYAPLCRLLATEAGMRVIAPDFPQAPEHPFPAALDALGAFTVSIADKYRGPLFLAGDSAGGTLAAVLSLDARTASAVTGLALFYPVLDLRPGARYRSRRRLGSGKYFLSESGILGAAAMYCGETGDPDDPKISPILEPRVSELPPIFLLIPDLDPLKDECEQFAARLQKSRLLIEMFRAKNTIHGCVSFSGRIPQGLEGVRRAAAFIEKACERADTV